MDERIMPPGFVPSLSTRVEPADGPKLVNAVDGAHYPPDLWGYTTPSHNHSEPVYHITPSVNPYPPGAFVLRPAPVKKVSTAYWLWVFFAFVGAHRFYVGHTGMGAAMLFMTLTVILWPVSVVIAIVDLFFIPRWVDAANRGAA
jgi:TM2 domain-containing membrane protein YozV